MATDLDHKAFDRLASLYAVGALNTSDRTRFENHLELCHQCVNTVLSLLPIAHALTRAVPYSDGPAELRTRICKTDTSSPPKQDSHGKEVPSRITFNVAATVCLLVAGSLGWYASQQHNMARLLEENLDAANDRAVIAEIQTAVALAARQEANQHTEILTAQDLVIVDLSSYPLAPSARGRVYWSNEQDILLTASGLPPAPVGRTYYLWFVPASDPVSGGPLTLDNEGRITAVVTAPAGVSAPVPMAVTLEPDNDITAPSGEAYLFGRGTN